MFDEDFSVFFNPDELSDQFVLRKDGRVIDGILDREYIDTNDVSGYAPILVCRTDQLYNIKREDIIEHLDDVYRFIKQEPDGTGVSRVILEQANE